MMTPAQIRGMLLEEAVLYLLRRTGYRTIDSENGDPTLDSCGAGLQVRGRGSKHQIDAIADYLVQPPFGNPQRLLGEAKCYGQTHPIGLDITRNAVGVLKDVSEYWTPSAKPVAGRKRYHYQYAIFSSSRFSKNAQRYAFAQDIYLVPLGRSTFFAGILLALNRVAQTPTQLPPPPDPPPPPLGIRTEGEMAQLRKSIRTWLRSGVITDELPASIQAERDKLDGFISKCRELDYVLLAVLGGRFPILLVPREPDAFMNIEDEVQVRIYWNDRGWYLKNSIGEPLFSFDLPDELFELYAKEGSLSEHNALNLKREFMSSFQALWTNGNQIRLIRFVLDDDWMRQIRRGTLNRIEPNYNE